MLAFWGFAMMNVSYGGTLEMSEEFIQAKQATKLLETILGPSASRVTAEWDRLEDSEGRPLITLRIADWSDAKSTKFTPSELKQPRHLRARLYRLWGDLLQARNEKQLAQLKGDGGEGE
jgi:hypothetical protein